MLHITVPTSKCDSAVRAPRFSCSRYGAGNACRVTVAGGLDIATVTERDKALRRAQADAALVILDLRELEFTDSSGVYLILAADRRVRLAGGRLARRAWPRAAQRLFALIGIDRQLEFVDQPPTPTRPPGFGKGVGMTDMLSRVS